MSRSQGESEWKGPDVPLWQGLLLVVVLLAIGAVTVLSPLPQWLAIGIVVLAIAVTARWWRPWLRRPRGLE